MPTRLAQPSAPAASDLGYPLPNPAQRSILVVEDEAVTARRLQADLEALGYRVAGIAAQAAEALQFLERAQPDLILMDIVLRGEMDGIEAATVIRRRYEIPVIFVTALADKSTVERAEQASPFGYLLKPVRREALGLAIDHALDRHRLERQMARSEARYRELFETSLDGIAVTDRQGEILECNPAFARLLGYEPASLAGKNIGQFTPPTYIAAEEALIKQALERGHSDEFSKEYMHPDGRRVPASVRLWTRADDQGEIIGFWAIVRDLSELQQSEQARALSELRLQSLIEQTPTCFAVVTGDGRVMRWNPATERLTGLPAAEALNRPIWEIWHQLAPPGRQTADLRLALEAEMRATLSGGPPSPLYALSQVQIRAADGEGRSLERSVFPIQAGEQAMFGVVMRDVTARLADQARIRRTTEFADRLAQAAGRLNGQLDAQRIFELIGAELSEVLAASAVTLFLYEPAAGRLNATYRYGVTGDGPISYPLSQYQELVPAGQLVRVIQDVQQVADSEHLERAKARQVQTLVVANLLHDDRLIGAIFLAYIGKGRQFEEGDITFLTTYAHQAAIAIDRAQIYREARRRAAELELLNRLSTQLRLANTRQEMLPMLLEEAMRLTGAAVGAIYLIDNRGRPAAAFHQAHGPHAYGDWFTPGGPLWTRAVKDETELIHSMPNAPAGPRPGQLATRLTLSLRSNQSAVGIIALGFSQPFTLADEARQACRALLEIGGNALQRSGLTELLEQHVRDRTRELTALYDLTLFTNTQLDLDDMLAGSLNRVVQAVEAQAAMLYQYQPGLARLDLMAQVALPRPMLAAAQQLSLTGEVRTWLEHGEAPWLALQGQTAGPLASLAASGAWGTVLNVPVRFEGQTLALMCVLWQAAEDIAAEDIALLGAAAERLGGAIQNRALRRQAEQAAVLEERQRLARELHDSVTQLIFGLTVLSEAGLDLAARGDLAALQGCLAEQQRSSLQALREMRLMLFELRPAPVRSLAEALQTRLDAVERRTGIDAELLVEGALGLPEPSQIELYQVASEALNNCLKHSGASRLTLRLAASPDAFQMVIQDNGRGFEVEKAGGAGMGLGNMRERVARLGGELTIDSQPGKGCCVRVRLGQAA